MDDSFQLVNMKPSKQGRRNTKHANVTAAIQRQPNPFPCTDDSNCAFTPRYSNASNRTAESFWDQWIGISPFQLIGNTLAPTTSRSCQELRLLAFQRMLSKLEQLNNVGPINSQKVAKNHPHGSLQMTEDFDVAHWREMHSAVLLHLGNMDLAAANTTTKQQQQQARENDTGEPDDDETLTASSNWQLMTTLCECLSEIYQRRPTNTLFSRDEMHVALEVVLQHANSIQSPIRLQEESRNSTTERNQVLFTRLFESLLNVLSILLTSHDATIDHVENSFVFMSRVWSMADGETGGIDNNRHSHLCRRTHSIVRKLTQHQNQIISRSAKIALSAMSLIHRLTGIKGEIQRPFDSQDTGFLYSRCLAQSHHGAIMLSQDSGILEQLTCAALDHHPERPTSEGRTNLKLVATACLSQIASEQSNPKQQYRKDGAPDAVRQALIRIVIQSPDRSVRIQTIPGLEHCINQPTISMEPSNVIPKIMSAVRSIAMDTKPGPDGSADSCRLGAAKILVHLIQHGISMTFTPEADNVSNRTTINYPHAMACLQELLQSDNEDIVHLAATTLQIEAMKNGPTILLQCPKILAELATTCCDPFANWELKRITIETLDHLTQTDGAAFSILARHSKILQAVVALASIETDMGIQHGPVATAIKRMALSVLMRLAKDVCNRRILAKQVGVLACMIRYARTISDTQDEETAGCLTDLKQNIMDLAVAL